MNIGMVLFKTLNQRRRLSFGLSDVLFCVFMHDFDKVQRYKVLDNGSVEAGSYSTDYLLKTATILKDNYGYILTDYEYNALKYAHGEGDDYHPTDRIMLPLATVVHCADIISARIWFDYGRDHSEW